MPTPRSVPATRNCAVRELDVRLGGFEEVGGDPLAARDDPLRRAHQRAAGGHHGARADRAAAVRHQVGVAVDEADALRGDAELLGGDLAEHRLVPLAVVVAAHQQGDAAARIEADLGRLLQRAAVRAAGALDGVGDCRCRAACRAPSPPRAAPRSRASRRPPAPSPCSAGSRRCRRCSPGPCGTASPRAGSCSGGAARPGPGRARPRRGRCCARWRRSPPAARRRDRARWAGCG